MSNGELQPDKRSEDLPVRKTRIRKGLERTLNTERYQQLVIRDEIEEEFEWKTLTEREKKIRNWETLLLKNFKKFHDQALDELGLEHKKAYFKENKNTVSGSVPKGVNDLDSLDSLE